ncbi:NAD-dependent epimerase/dehydratase family protein [Muricoccus vinaceus]|uniref:NAD-dependent epimerase/dehydratase family protein n=1 Tax=Muricoccus vinaceus TaxID=424704 RepID=A0ABV6J0V9_9PROT
MTNKPTVAVTGVSGFTGGALAARLAAEGHVVRGLARAPLPAPGIELVQGDLSDRTALARLVEGADTVFHVAAMYRTEGSAEEFMAVNRDGTRMLLELAEAAGVRRFVYCSSIGVHGSVAVTPGDENAPMDPRDPYQDSKLAAEEVCHEATARGRMEVVIIRPCGIYGPGDTRMLKMFRMLQRGAFVFVGDGSPNFHPVFIDDLVQGFMLAMTVPAAAGETFIIGGDYLPLRDYVATAARAIGVEPPRRRLPYGLMNAAARVCEALCAPLGIQPPLHRRRLTFFKHNRAFSTEKARRLLGYRPAVPLPEGFRRTVAWYRETGLLPPGRG